MNTYVSVHSQIQNTVKMNLKQVFSIPGVGIVFFISFLASCGGPSDDGYFVDAEHGDDSNSGTSRKEPWQTVEKVNSMTFKPGDNIYFKRQIDSPRSKLRGIIDPII